MLSRPSFELNDLLNMHSITHWKYLEILSKSSSGIRPKSSYAIGENVASSVSSCSRCPSRFILARSHDGLVEYLWKFTTHLWVDTHSWRVSTHCRIIARFVCRGAISRSRCGNETVAKLQIEQSKEPENQPFHFDSTQ
jgi:hypothetical protein